MTNIKFFVTGIKAEKDKILLYGTTKTNKKIVLIDEDYQPYFYVMPKNKSEFEKLLKKINIKYKEEKKNFLQKEDNYIKIYYTDKLKTLENLEDQIKDKKETDIPISKKYLLDKNIMPLNEYEAEGELTENEFFDIAIKFKSIKETKNQLKNPDIMAFDIETMPDNGGYPNPKKNPILSIAFYSEKKQGVITWKKARNAIVEDSEQEMILKFQEIINQEKPDYLVGYFSNGFDMPYLRERCKKLNLPFKIGIDKAKSKGGIRQYTETFGVHHIDILYFIMRIMANSLKLDNYTLANVSQTLTGEKKLDFDFEKINEKNINKQMNKLCKYNLNDARITYLVTKKLLPNILELSKLIKQPLQDTARMSYGQMVEWFIISNLDRFNEVAPEKPTHNLISERVERTYQGAFVYEPKPGLYKNIAMLDFKGLYPSIIITHNISLSTITDKKTNTHKSPEIRKGKRYYFTKKKGFIPELINELVEARTKIKNKLKKTESKTEKTILLARSYALKTVANASYGYMGFFGARWYSRDCAEAITAYARDYIIKTIEEAKKQFKIIYGDTDSVFIQSNNKQPVKEFLKKINSKLPGVMELELEGFFPRGIFVMKKGEKTGAKKKYALIDEKGKIDVKGFETVRRDWSYVAKELQKEILKIILKENDVKKAFRLVKKTIKEIRNKKYPMDKLVIRTQLQKDIKSYRSIGPHVAVAKQMIKKGMPVSVGSTIRYVVCEGKGNIRDKAKIPEDAKNYDEEYYINNQIIPSIEKIFETLGYSKNQLIEKGTQSSLGDF